MRIAMFSTKNYDRLFFERQNSVFKHDIQFIEMQLNEINVKTTAGYDAVCVFVNDEVNRKVIQELSKLGIKLIALRCAGFNNIDLAAAKEFNICVVRVPEYSPNAVAEHALALIQTLNRKTHKAYNRVREGNFSLQGLLGFDLNQKTVGIIGTGKIGTIFAKIMQGIGCNVIAYDPVQSDECSDLGVNYVSLDQLFKQADIISLHCPLNSKSKYIINQESISSMKSGVMIINTGRGGLVDTKALIQGLKSEKIAYVGLDVYEEEADLFFEDNSEHPIQDEVFARLMTFPNVLITGHQGFFTDTALTNIAQTTLQSLSHYQNRGHCRGLPSCVID